MELKQLKMHTVDEALTAIGRLGKYQMLVYLAVSLPAVVIAFHTFCMTFVGGEAEHRCEVSDRPAGTGTGIGQSTQNLSELLPGGWDEKLGRWKWDECQQYVTWSADGNKSLGTGTTGTTGRTTDTTDSTTASRTVSPCQDGWNYDDTLFQSTISTDFDLVCDHAYLVPLTTTIYFIGLGVGSVAYTYLSDRFGRKHIMMVCFNMIGVCGLASALSPNIYVFFALRFLTATFVQGAILISIVYLTELFHTSHRHLMGLLGSTLWSLGFMALALLAYWIRNWRDLMVAISVPFFLTIPLWWFIPESLHWLVAHGQAEKAEKILERAARMNGCKLPAHCLTRDQTVYVTAKQDPAIIGKQRNIIDIFRTRALVPSALIVTFLWLVNSLVYYGLSMSTSTLSGDLHLNFLLSGLAELPAAFVAVCMMKYGRRKPLFFCLVLAGVPLIISPFLPKEAEMFGKVVEMWPVVTAMAMIGKFGIACSFTVVLLYTSELYPTVVRNAGVGLASVGARVGGMLAPFAVPISKELPALPPLLFGGLAVATAFLVTLLPTTINVKLPERLSDVRNGWRPSIPIPDRHSFTPQHDAAEERRRSSKTELMRQTSAVSNPADLHAGGIEMTNVGIGNGSVTMVHAGNES